MAIDPTVITTQNVGSLPTSPINLTDKFPHEVDGYLKQSSVNDLAVFIAAYVGAASALVFNTTKVTTGQTLPATTKKEFLFVGAGTFTNVGGGASITTTQGLNVLTSNGSIWTLAVEVPVTVTFNGLVQTIRQGFTGTVTSEGALYDALELIKADVIKSAPFLGSIVPTSTPTNTVNAYWLATQAGTYTNYGGVVVDTNSFAVISVKDGFFSSSQTPIDLSSKADLLAGKNLFSVSTKTDGIFIDGATGATISDVNYTVSDFIPITALTQYIGSSVFRHGALYNSSKVFLAGGTTANTNTITPVSGAAYVRLSLSLLTVNPTTFQFEQGSTSTTYQPYTKVVPASQLDLSLYPKTDTIILPDYVVNHNLFKLKNRQLNKYVQNPGAVIVTGTGWECSDYIPVVAGSYYLSALVKTRTGVGFYNSAKVPLRYADIIKGLVTVNSGEAYVVFNLKSDVSGGYSEVQFETGTIATAYMNGDLNIIKKENVEGLVPLITQVNVNEDKLDELYTALTVISTNLFNPNTTTLGVLNDLTGSISSAGTNANYNTSDFIDVTASTVYSFMNINSSFLARKVVFYNASKVYVSGLNGYIGSATIPSGCTYMRISVANSANPSAPSVGVNQLNGYGVFLGASPVWEEWYLPHIEVPDNEIIENGQISYLYSVGGSINVTNDFGNLGGQVLNSKGYFGNNMFKVVVTTQGTVTVGSVDDVAPMHIWGWTMGANHAWTTYFATITAHSFTNVDIGTEFIQGGIKFYLMRIVNANTVAFVSENLGTTASPNFQILLTGTITRGANNYTISASVADRLYPSIGELTQKVISNGIDVLAGSGVVSKTDKLEVVERYVIYDPTSVLNATIARAGTSDAPTFIGNPAVGVNNVYRFVKEKALLVFANHQFYQSVSLENIMTAQAVCIGANDGVTQYYVPNSNPLNGTIDLRTPTAILWSTSIPTTYVVNSTQPNPLIPPNRVIQYRGNTGFMMAYILTRGTGVNIANYTDRTFEIRNNTGKVYPHPIEGTKVGATATTDTVFSTAMARVYTNLAETRVGNRLSMFEFSVDDEKHIYLDYSGSMLDTLVLNDLSLNGKQITVLESSNAVLLTLNYNNNLIVKATYVSGQTSYIVLMIK